MLPAKTTLPAGAALALAGNKPASPSTLSVPAGSALALASNKAASPSLLSVKQAPAGGVVLAVDAKRSMATRAAAVGRGAFSDPDDDLEPKGFSLDQIKEMAQDTSGLLRSLIPEQASFTKELEALQKVCDAIADGAGVDEN